MLEISSVVLKKFGFEKSSSARLDGQPQLYEQSFILFSDTKSKAKTKLAKPLAIWQFRTVKKTAKYFSKNENWREM